MGSTTTHSVTAMSEIVVEFGTSDMTSLNKALTILMVSTVLQ
jgi:hypothetical protein